MIVMPPPVVVIVTLSPAINGLMPAEPTIDVAVPLTITEAPMPGDTVT